MVMLARLERATYCLEGRWPIHPDQFLTVISMSCQFGKVGEMPKKEGPLVAVPLGWVSGFGFVGWLGGRILGDHFNKNVLFARRAVVNDFSD